MPMQFKLPLNTLDKDKEKQEEEDALYCAMRLIYRCSCSFFSIIFGLPVMFCLLRVCVETHTHTLGLFIQMRLSTNEKSCVCCLEKHLRVRSKCHRK